MNWWYRDLTKTLEFVKSISVDRTIDYSKEDAISNRETFDVFLDLVGNVQFKDVKPTPGVRQSGWSENWYWKGYEICPCCRHLQYATLRPSDRRFIRLMNTQ